MEAKMQTKPVPNPRQDLIDCINYLEQMIQKPTISRQTNLKEEVNKLQALFARTFVDYLNSTPDSLNPTEMSYARTSDGKKHAIRLVKDRLGCGMLEAKEIIERWQTENNVDPFGGQR